MLNSSGSQMVVKASLKADVASTNANQKYQGFFRNVRFHHISIVSYKKKEVE